MRVLSLADARALETLIRGHGERAADAGAGAAPADDDEAAHVLLELPTSEVVRLGLISNRGMLIVAAAIGVLAQSSPQLIGRMVEGPVGYLIGWGRELHLGVVGWLMEENGFPIAPAILGLVLGEMLEQNFMTSMIKADGSLLFFLQRPIAACLVIATILIRAAMLWRAFNPKPGLLPGVPTA
jgi:hypothetical protein